MMSSRTDDTAIMLADFGLGAFALPDAGMKLPCGTLTFTAPEVLIGKGYGMEVDLVCHTASRVLIDARCAAARALLGRKLQGLTSFFFYFIFFFLSFCTFLFWPPLSGPSA